MLVVLNCTLLHDQNYGRTVPNSYFRASCKNIYLRLLFKKPALLDKDCYMILELFYERIPQYITSDFFQFSATRKLTSQ